MKYKPISQAKPVKCIETGRVFRSSEEAARDTRINAGTIRNACRGKQKTGGGYHWEYAQNVATEMYPGGLCKRKRTCRWSSTSTGRDAQRDTHLICYYAVLAGQARGCPADRCDKYEEKRKGPTEYGRHNYDS